MPRRAPFFCAGCPHNRSTLVPAGSTALGGIGCHTLALFMGRFTKGLFVNMGVRPRPHLPLHAPPPPRPRTAAESVPCARWQVEGANWIALQRFLARQHTFVNVGDGTYVHSAVLAVRACVAAGASMTFKILSNNAVAMTGGQANDTGALSAPPAVARQLLAEGVREVVIVSEFPDVHAAAGAQEGVSVVGRGELMAVQERLEKVMGVTAIIYDQDCATEKRRKRKRGLAPAPKTRVVISERVCEGCGDCGVKSNCVAVEAVGPANPSLWWRVFVRSWRGPARGGAGGDSARAEAPRERGGVQQGPHLPRSCARPRRVLRPRSRPPHARQLRRCWRQGCPRADGAR